MNKKTIITCLIVLACCPAVQAKVMNYAFGIYSGMAPALGGNLSSYNQYAYFNSLNGGITGMNRDKEGVATSNIEKLTGASFGVAVKALYFDYYFLRLGFYSSIKASGGKGKTVFTPDGGTTYYPLKCTYNYYMYDMPITAGLSIPFWKDMKISISCGVAYAYGVYKNKFDVPDQPLPYKREGEFKGSGWPLVVHIEGDYFVADNISINASISYYRGSTKIIEDSNDTDRPKNPSDEFDLYPALTNEGVIDYAKIDFTGYRFHLGISFYIFTI